MGNRNLWTDCDEILNCGRYLRHNHLSKFLRQLIKGFYVVMGLILCFETILKTEKCSLGLGLGLTFLVLVVYTCSWCGALVRFYRFYRAMHVVT